MAHWLDEYERHPGWPAYKRRNLPRHQAEQGSQGDFVRAESECLIQFATELQRERREVEAEQRQRAAAPAPATERYVTRKQLDALARAMAKAIKAHVHERIAEVEKRLGEREAMRFEGAHDGARAYDRGMCVQRQGALWICTTPTRAAPGQSSDWRRLAMSKP
jgi:hypothetical protein